MICGGLRFDEPYWWLKNVRQFPNSRGRTGGVIFTAWWGINNGCTTDPITVSDLENVPKRAISSVVRRSYIYTATIISMHVSVKLTISCVVADIVLIIYNYIFPCWNLNCRSVGGQLRLHAGYAYTPATPTRRWPIMIEAHRDGQRFFIICI